jgi:hypothetical protein
MLARYATRAGVFKITRTGGEKSEMPINPRVLRHSFAARALARGIDVHDLQRLLGHSSLQTTGVYLHARDERLAERFRIAMEPEGDARGVVAGVVREELRELATAEFVAQLPERIRSDRLTELVAILQDDDGQ